MGLLSGIHLCISNKDGLLLYNISPTYLLARIKQMWWNASAFFA